MNYIECINVDYKSTRKESFYGIYFLLMFMPILIWNTEMYPLKANSECVYCLADLQLDVKGCQDVYASFDKYVEVERLEGDNKYHAEEHGLQVSFFFEVTGTGPKCCFIEGPFILWLE